MYLNIDPSQELIGFRSYVEPTTLDEYSVLLYEEDNGITLEIDIEEKIFFGLPSNPST